jgi:glucose-6-phosphate isomerase
VPALLDLALAANEEALASDERPSARYILPKMDERNLGQLLMFLMLSIAYEGELAGVDAYDQPGVEAYKRIMQKELGKK